MKVLWQYHSITARGDNDIIIKANNNLAYDFLHALSTVANGMKRVHTVEEADNYFRNTESGVVSEEIDNIEEFCDCPLNVDYIW